MSALRKAQSAKPPAGIAHLVERCLAKAEVAGSSPVSRSICTLSSVGRAPDS